MTEIEFEYVDHGGNVIQITDNQVFIIRSDDGYEAVASIPRAGTREYRDLLTALVKGKGHMLYNGSLPKVTRQTDGAVVAQGATPEEGIGIVKGVHQTAEFAEARATAYQALALFLRAEEEATKEREEYELKASAWVEWGKKQKISLGANAIQALVNEGIEPK